MTVPTGLRYRWVARLFLLILFLAAPLCAQEWEQAQPRSGADQVPYWISMMREDADFYRTRANFDAYFRQRQQQRGNGWKPFKRWEHSMELRLTADNRRPPPDGTYNALRAYLALGADAMRTAAGNWTPLGPMQQPSLLGTSQPIGVGRVNAVAFDPVKAHVIYVGTPAGGLWRSQDNGTNWEALTDMLPRLGVSTIAPDHSNPHILYIGTGDRDAFDTRGIGVMKTRDGGSNWSTCTNGMGALTVNDLIMHPDDPLTLLAATSDGVFRTRDGGNAWERTWGKKVFCTEIVFKPGDPSTVYLSATGSVYRSSDMGASWRMPATPPKQAYRVALAVTPANPDYVYCLTTPGETFGGVYRSADSGQTFELRADRPNLLGWETDGSDGGGQGWYDLALAADPNDAETVYVGGVNIWKSTDGGAQWRSNTDWRKSVHADHHALEFSPDGRLFVGNDGGAYVTEDGGQSWKDISAGMNIGQIYRISQSAQEANLVLAGFQDNGTSLLDGSWLAVAGGDGMDCAIDPTNPDIMYAEYYNGYMNRSTDRGRTFRALYPPGLQSEMAAWVMPFFLDVRDPRVLYAGCWNVWRTRNAQAPQPSWERVSNLGGKDAYSCITVLKQSTADSRLLYAARRDRSLYRCDDIMAGTPAWAALTASLPWQAPINDVQPHPREADTVYIIQNHRIYHSTDRGVEWDRISSNLPDVALYCLAYDSENDVLYVGTEIGVFFRRAAETDWTHYSGDLPNVPIYDMEFHNEGGGKIRAATFGRGLWEAPLIPKTTGTGARTDPDVLAVEPGDPFGITTPRTESVELLLGTAPDPAQAALRLRYTATGFATWFEGKWIRVGTPTAAATVYGKHVMLESAIATANDISWLFVHSLPAGEEMGVYEASPDGTWAQELRVTSPEQ